MVAIVRESDAYAEFLVSKSVVDRPTGLTSVRNLGVHESVFPFQRDVIRWALQRGRAAIWADCGLGKSLMQLEWARHVVRETGGQVLVLAPLAVAAQTAREAAKFGISGVVQARSTIDAPITVTNYEMLDHFDPTDYVGVVLDESSILKAFDGRTRNQIVESFGETPFRLACTATPAPNDYEELGNHAEFLGIMTRAEMLSCFFVHDGARTSQWRLKGHAEEEFWRWICTWAVMIRKPSDLGYDDGGFALPPIEYFDRVVAEPVLGRPADWRASTLTEQREARRGTLAARVLATAHLVNASRESWVVWCDLNAEGDALEASIPDSVQVSGSDSLEEKERKLSDFASGAARVIVTKPSIAGFGLNWQHCARMAFVGLSHSYEALYQAVRRCWRFGQTRPVEVHLVTSAAEGAVVENVKRKEEDAARLGVEMVRHMSEINREDLRATERQMAPYAPRVESGLNFAMALGDCVDLLQSADADDIGFSIFSPPFSSLYTYSNSDRDMGNCKSHDEFFQHFRFLVAELLRVTMPGRLAAVHCMNLPTLKSRDGFIGVFDFRGAIVRAFTESGWIFHSEVCIWKDPVVAQQRTKALGLLYKQLRKDSSMSRQGLPDYLVVFRKPGVSPQPVAHTPEEFPLDVWQKWASPVWVDINPSDTLQYRSVREDRDEKHICPLQLSVIERAIRLWSNPGDTVFSPFAGIGSEGVVALRTGRRFVGVELKESYFTQAVANLHVAVEDSDPRRVPDEDGLADAKLRVKRITKSKISVGSPEFSEAPVTTSNEDEKESADHGNVR